MKYKVPFIRPDFPDFSELAHDYNKIIERNWFTNFGPYEQEFSRQAATYIGHNSYATTIANCTLGLEAVIELLFNKKFSRIIMPSFTFAAGAEALIRGGFNPVFIDIDPVSWQPNIQQARQLLQEDPTIGGVLLCNTFGVGNEQVGEWEALLQSHTKPLIIDSAAGFGSKYSRDEKVGARGDCEVFSLHATKPFAVGEGGLVISKNKKLIEEVRSWQNFGFQADRKIHSVGTNAKMQEINAAIGLHQLKHFDKHLKQRREVLAIYKKGLIQKGFVFQQNDELSTIPFVSVLAPKADDIIPTEKRLLANNVEVRRYYRPLHDEYLLEPFLQEGISLEVTNDIASRILSLPVHNGMTQDVVGEITANVVG